MRQAVLRGRQGKWPQSVRGTGKGVKSHFLRAVLCEVECVDEAQDVCFTYMPSWMFPGAFRATVRVLSPMNKTGYQPGFVEMQDAEPALVSA